MQSRQFRSDEDDPGFRKHSTDEDLVPEKVKARASWPEISKKKSAEPILKELIPLRVEALQAQHWSEIVNKNIAGNGRKDLKHCGTKEMQAKGCPDLRRFLTL